MQTRLSDRELSQPKSLREESEVQTVRRDGEFHRVWLHRIRTLLLDTVQSGLSGCTAELYMPWVSEVLQEIGQKMGDRPYQKCFSKLHLIISNCFHVLPDDW